MTSFVEYFGPPHENKRVAYGPDYRRALNKQILRMPASAAGLDADSRETRGVGRVFPWIV